MSLRHRKFSAESADSEVSDDFKALYIIIFSCSANTETIRWIIDLMKRSQFDGGAELIVRETYVKEEGTIVEIGAKLTRLLQGAEMLEIMKEDNQGNIREFVFSQYEQFVKPGCSVDNILSTGEKQRIILEELISIRSMEKKKLTGYSNIQLFPGQSIIQVCKKNDVILNIFPLHEPKELKLLKNNWKFIFFSLSDIRDYFGEAVAFYFAFVLFYTHALFVPAIIGILQTIISADISQSYVLFATVKMIWLTIFLEMWKRRSNELAYTWGTLKLVSIPKLNPTFRGKHMDMDPVTRQYVPVYPGYKRHLKVYCGTLPVVILCLGFAFAVMLIYYQVEKFVIDTCDDGSMYGWMLTQIPGIVYAVLVYLMNLAYSYLATILTEWENHKLQESFDNHRIVKLLLFEFVNNFIAMGYIAFYEQDLNLLKWQICIMMVVNHLINKFQEAIFPFLIKKYQQRLKSKDYMTVPHKVKEILLQRNMWSYEGTYDDYLALFMQFGYVFLFSAVFPLAAAIAILNNIIEIWTDRFKLCYAYQRPQARPVRGIGIWQLAFEVLSLFAVMTNCALISMSPAVKSYFPEMSITTWLLAVVVVEHVIIAVKLIVSYLISDIPKWVSVAIQKHQYESLQASKMQRQIQNQVFAQKFNLQMTKME